MVFLPESIWKRRLESEFQEMQRSGERFDYSPDFTTYTITIAEPGVVMRNNSLSVEYGHKVEVKLKREYPYPGGIEVTWLTPIFHPNIRSEDGKVCIRLVNEWMETNTVLSVVNALKQLVKNPNPNDPLNKEAAEFMMKNPNAFADLLNGTGNGNSFPKRPRLISGF